MQSAFVALSLCRKVPLNTWSALLYIQEQRTVTGHVTKESWNSLVLIFKCYLLSLSKWSVLIFTFKVERSQYTEGYSEKQKSLRFVLQQYLYNLQYYPLWACLHVFGEGWKKEKKKKEERKRERKAVSCLCTVCVVWDIYARLFQMFYLYIITVVRLLFPNQ